MFQLDFYRIKVLYRVFYLIGYIISHERLKLIDTNYKYLLYCFWLNKTQWNVMEYNKR